MPGRRRTVRTVSAPFVTSAGWRAHDRTRLAHLSIAALMPVVAVFAGRELRGPIAPLVRLLVAIGGLRCMKFRSSSLGLRRSTALRAAALVALIEVLILRRGRRPGQKRKNCCGCE